MSLVLYLFNVSLMLVSPTARSQPPPVCLTAPGKSQISLLLCCFSQGSPTHHHRKGSQPWAMLSASAPYQLWRHRAASPCPTPGSDLPMLERDLPRVADQTPPALTSAIPMASSRGFLTFSFPLCQPSGGGDSSLHCQR